jgi:hypothetical protein
MLTNVLARLTPPCRDITRLLSESMDRTLPWSVRANMRLHLLICEGCRRYAAQLRAVRNSLRGQSGNEGMHTASPNLRLSEEASTRLKRALKSRGESQQPFRTDRGGA